MNYCNLGFGQDFYNYSKKLKKYQSTNISASEIDSVNQKIEKASLNRDTIEVIRSLIDKGIISQLLSKHDSSLNSFYKANILSEEINNQSLKANCFLGLSNLFYRLADNNKSLEYCIRAEKIFTHLNDTVNALTASLFMGQVLTDLMDFNRANDSYMSVLKQAQKLKDSITLAEIYNQKGALDFFQNKYKQAISNYEKSLLINKSLNNTINIGINYANIGEAYMYLGDFEKALRYLFLALETEKKANYISTSPFIYYTLAQTYSLLNQDDKAIEYFNESIRLVNKIGEMKEKPIIFLLLSEYYVKKGDYKKALNAHKSYVSEKEKLSSEANRLQINELNIKYDADKKEKELFVMRAEKKLQEESIIQHNKRIRLQKIIIILVGFILVFSTGFIVYFIFNQKKLHQANQTKDILFSIIAHDLRGPMGTIKQIVHHLDACKEVEKERFINILKRPTEKAYDLLEDLLSWSHTINNKLEKTPEAIYISTLVNDILELLSPLASDKKVSFSNMIPENIVVKADKNQLSTIIRNLILNAIKYNKIGESVEIFHSINKNRLKIHIKDHGVGIEPQNIKKILSTNQFFTTYGTKDEKGTGLGLILAQNFIKKHGGKLEIESELDKGSTFSFTIPLDKTKLNN